MAIGGASEEEESQEHFTFILPLPVLAWTVVYRKRTHRSDRVAFLRTHKPVSVQKEEKARA